MCFQILLKNNIMITPALTKKKKEEKKIGSQVSILFFVNPQLPISCMQVLTLISRKTQRGLWRNFMRIFKAKKAHAITRIKRKQINNASNLICKQQSSNHQLMAVIFTAKKHQFFHVMTVLLKPRSHSFYSTPCSALA